MSKLKLHNFPSYITDVSVFEFNEVDMGQSTISFSIKLDAQVDPDFKLDWYVEFEDSKFILDSILPSGIKDNSSLMYKYDLIFKHESYELNNYPFQNMVTLVDGDLLPNLSTFQFQGNLTEFIDRFNLNLKYYLGNKWSMVYSSTEPISTDRITVSVDNASIWDMLTMVYDLYGVRWHFDGYTVKVGQTSEEIGHVFEYGADKGLYSIERVNPNDTIHTRLIGTGGNRNMPFSYFKTGDPDTNDIIKTMHFTGIVPAEYREYIQGWNAGVVNNTKPDAYNKGANDKIGGKNMQPINYAENNVDKWGVRYGSIQPNDTIYPTIQGMSKPILGRIDEVIAVEEITNDDWQEDESKLVSQTLPNMKASKVLRGGDDEWVTIDTRVFDIAGVESKVHIVLSSFPSDTNGKQPQSLLDNVDEVFSLVLFDSSGRIKVIPESEDGKYEITGIQAGRYYLRGAVKTKYNAPVSSQMNQTLEATSIKVENMSSVEFNDYFNIWIKDIGFDLRDEKYWTSDRMTMMFSDGLLAGEDYEFELVAEELPNGNLKPYIYEDATKEYNGIQSKYRVLLKKSDTELEASGKYLPNKMQNAKAGDHFFLININLPHEYVVDAEERVSEWLHNEVVNVSDEFPTYAIKPSSIFMEDFVDKDKVRVGTKIRVRDKQLTSNTYLPLHIVSQSKSYTSDKMLPSINIVVSDKIIASRNPLELLQVSINALNNGSISKQQAIGLSRQFEKFFLRKDGISETSYSPTRFVENVRHESTLSTVNIINDGSIMSNNFRQGDVSGEGYGIYKDENGNSVIEADKVISRRELIVNEIKVNQVSWLDGNQILSAAGMNVSKVEDTGSGWKCYFDTQEGSVRNHFKFGDFAYHQQTSHDGTEITNYLWKKITEIGDDYIVVSKSGGDGSGSPTVGSSIIQLGNETDTSRQGAIFFSAQGVGSPSIIQYSGINSFTLNGRMITKIAKDGNEFQGNFKIVTNGTTTVVYKDRGLFANGTQYYKNDRVSWLGSLWVCLEDTKTIPSETATYWRKETSGQADINNAVDEVMTEFSSELSVQNDKINAKVSQNDFNALDGRVSTAESNITQLSGSITSVVEKVDNIQVGGKNLVDNSSFESGLGNTSAVNNSRIGLYTEDSYQGTNCVLVDTTGVTTIDAGVSIFGINLKKGIYAASGYLKALSTSPTPSPFDVRIRFTTADWKGLSNYTGHNITNEWTRFVHTFEIKEDVVNGRLVILNRDLHFLIDCIQIESGNQITTWGVSQNDINKSIQKAEEKAIAAQTDATSAQNAANKAQTDANAANNLLADIASDSKLTPNEKQDTKKEWDIIVSEYPKNITQANKFSVSTTAYTNVYNALNSYITPLLANLGTTSDISGTTFNARFKAYYDARTDLLNATSAKAKDLADNAQSTANSKNNPPHHGDIAPAKPPRGYIIGDLWYMESFVDFDGNINPDSSKNLYQLQRRWNGSDWVRINWSATRAYTKNTGDRIEQVVSKTGIDSLGTGETLKSLIDQTPEKIELSVGKIKIGGRNLKNNSKTINGLFRAPDKLAVKNGDWMRFNISDFYEEVLQNQYVDVNPSTEYCQSVLFRTDANSVNFTFSWWNATNGHRIIPAIITKVGENTYRAYSVFKTAANDTTIRCLDISNLSRSGGTYIEFAYHKFELGNMPTDWSAAPEDIDKQIQEAENKATQAQQKITDMAKDTVLSAVEKKEVKVEMDKIDKEYAKLSVQGQIFNQSIVAYKAAYDALKAYINPLLAKMGDNSAIVPATYVSMFTNYNTEKVNLQNAIAIKNKDIADSKTTADEVKASMVMTADGFLFYGKVFRVDSTIIANAIETGGLVVTGGNFQVTKEGIMSAKGAEIQGKIESNDSGNRIVIDPSTRELTMVYSNGDIAASMRFDSNEWGAFSSLVLNRKRVTEDARSVSINGGSIHLGKDGSISNTQLEYGRFLMASRYKLVDIDVDKKATLSIKLFGMPTSKSGLESGELWRDGELLKIVP